ILIAILVGLLVMGACAKQATDSAQEQTTGNAEDTASDQTGDTSTPPPELSDDTGLDDSLQELDIVG
ncbi:MAG: hypothetical protein UY64_C0010G0025, partial [Parcubacteria group bacterium GW2011_GWA1_51_12]